MRYFVTGGSGFIGKRLIRNLLDCPDSTVWFLMREDSRHKLPELSAFWGPGAVRAIPVTGDVLHPELGLTAADRAALVRQVDHFFHLAAIYDLRAGPGPQMAANVGGTREAVRLAAALDAGCFHHMSSVAAAGMYDGVFREDMLDEAEGLWHPYFSTKHEAEQVVRRECRLPWRVYRPGLVVGDSRTGEADKADGPYYFFKLIQKMRRILPPWMPALGIEGGRINIVPVDYVVNAMQWIAHREGLDRQCFHLTDPALRRVGDVLNIFAHAAHAPSFSLRVNTALLNFLPAWIHQGMTALSPLRRLREAVMAELGLPDGIMGLLNWPTRFDSRQARAALEGSGIVCPPLESYAAAVWDYWERHLDPELSVERNLRAQVAGKVVLVTGGSSGIGLAAARRVADAGATTLICGRDGGRLAAAAAEIGKEGASVQAYQVDLADLAACEKFVQQVLADHGQVDILVNNAGRSIRRTVDASYDRFHDFQRMMQLNYFGAVRLTMGLLPSMVARGGGQVIVISSIGVLTSAPRFSAYIASKAALEAWAGCAAAEFADLGIVFTTINMPLVRTPMIAPTAAYRHAPAITPEEAASFVVRAIVAKPVRIATEVGQAGRALQVLAPRVAQTILNAALRLAPAEEADGTPATQDASPELLAMQQLLRGVHL
ncbi:SDR family oxidoreductase [Massilia sp. G4R7]|uniref:SDR family oxidoreductase n=1 Tax=Massilia phyllostachyos TaxID=2898585 RepID=A0ABS8QD03_9BURK|nr:SDR family oxidoreductase [Massilia phyllostachyos]MCD2519642.1 SDR family oxidoreductase [Massilia phyllostachyos]